MPLRNALLTAALLSTAAAVPLYAQTGSQGSSGAAVYGSPTGIKMVQSALDREGYRSGSSDGIFGSETAQALANYQKDKNLEPTGNLTVTSLNCLNLPDVVTGEYRVSNQGQQQNQSGQGQSGQNQGQNQSSNNSNSNQEQSGNQGAPLYFGPSEIRIAQRALNSEGFDAGPVDGKEGSRLSNAVENFERSHNLQQTGNLTIAVLSELGVDKAIFTKTCQSGSQQASGNSQQSGANEQQQSSGSGHHSSNTNETGGGTPVYLNPGMVRLIKQRLNSDGFHTGSMSAGLNQQASNAISSFQKSRNLDPTGNITTDTLTALGLRGWYAGQMQNTASMQGERHANFQGGQAGQGGAAGNAPGESTGNPGGQGSRREALRGNQSQGNPQEGTR